MRIPLFLYFLSVLFAGVVQMFRLVGWRNSPVQAQAFGTELWHFAGFFMENIPKRSFGGRNLHPELPSYTLFYTRKFQEIKVVSMKGVGM